jgi:hypothetical protein
MTGFGKKTGAHVPKSLGLARAGALTHTLYGLVAALCWPPPFSGHEPGRMPFLALGALSFRPFALCPLPFDFPP